MSTDPGTAVPIDEIRAATPASDARALTAAKVNEWSALARLAAPPTAITPEPLWAVHVAGPDDVVAMPDQAAADKMAAQINDIAEKLRRRADASPLDPHLSASVVEWDGTAEEHAVGVAELAEQGGYTP